MPEDLSALLATSAAAAWLTKTVVDLIRQRLPSLDGNYVLVLALVLGLAFNALWTLYRGDPFAAPGDYARVAIQGFLAFLGAVVTTEVQTATKRIVSRSSK